MASGVQIIEPGGLQALFANPAHFEFAVAIYAWLIEEITSKRLVPEDRVELEIVCAEYHGRYPAIGIRYHDPNDEDLGPLVERAIDRLLREAPVIALVDALGSSSTSWAAVTRKLMNQGNDNVKE